MHIQEEARTIEARRIAADPPVDAAFADLPSAEDLSDKSWYFALQDFVVQFYTFFLAWFALLFTAAVFFWKTVQTRSVTEFDNFLNDVHWGLVWAWQGIGIALLICFAAGILCLLSGTFSKISIVAKYRYDRGADIWNYHLPPWSSPLTKGRLIIMGMSIVFGLWKQIIIYVDKAVT